MPVGAANTAAAMWRSGDPDQQIAAARMAELFDAEGNKGDMGLVQAALAGPPPFNRRDRATQRAALDLADVGIPPAKAIERAEAETAKLAAEEANQAASDSVPASGPDIAGPEGRETPTTGAFGRMAGMTAQSLDRNRADAAAKAEGDETPPQPQADPDDVFTDRSLTPRTYRPTHGPTLRPRPSESSCHG